MRPRILVGGLLVTLALTTMGGGGRAAGATAPRRQWAVTYLHEPTLIGTTIVEGPVLFIHDSAKMARGEPCTTIRLFDPGSGPADELATFHCTPKARPVVSTFTVTTIPNVELGFGCILTEYQFAGDNEGHGVPPFRAIPVPTENH